MTEKRWPPGVSRFRPWPPHDGFSGYSGDAAGVEAALPDWWPNDGSPRWTTWSGEVVFADAADAAAKGELELARIELPWPMPVSIAKTHRANGDIEAFATMRFQMGAGRAAPSIFARFPGMVAPFISFVQPETVFLLPARMLIVYASMSPAAPAATFPVAMGVVLAPVAPMWSP